MAYFAATADPVRPKIGVRFTHFLKEANLTRIDPVSGGADRLKSVGTIQTQAVSKRRLSIRGMKIP